MPKKISYGHFASEMSIRQRQVSYNYLTPKLPCDAAGNTQSYQPPKVKLRGLDFYRLLQPYVKTRLLEQLIAVLPLVMYLVAFQWLVFDASPQNLATITLGLLAVVLGLMLFMEGLKLGLMPFGESIGEALPRKLPLGQVLFIAFLLGVGVTFAEPAIGALKTAGSIVDPNNAPLLYAVLNQWSDVLVLVVGAGVGLAAVIAILRFIYTWSLKPLIYLTLLPVLSLTLYMSLDTELQPLLGLAWDCGAVTTGPVTVPLVLALGIGVASAASHGSDSISGFGIVTLASLFPVLAVLLLGLYVAHATPELVTASQLLTPSAPPWYAQSPYTEILMGLRAIVPLILFLLFIMLWVLREKISHPHIITYGLVLSVLGMIVFNLGLTYGLTALGEQAGNTVPGVFHAMGEVGNVQTPVFDWFWLGILTAFLFAWLLGFGATLAEPALHALGLTVENLTHGAFKKSLLIYAVSFGVALGIGLGVLKLIFGLSLAYFLIPGYSLAILLTVISNEEYVNIAWDSAGVTTGPITVPLVLAMGLGFGNAVNAVDGFGILALASIGPILTVLAMGLWIEWQVRCSHQKVLTEPTPSTSSARLQPEVWYDEKVN